MNYQKRVATAISVLSLAFVMIFGCGKKSYIDVSYTIPNAPEAQMEKAIWVQTKDLRPETDLFIKEAKNEFQHFTGLFSLRVLQENAPDKLEGAFDLSGLFKKVLSKRLEKMALTLSDAPSPGHLVFQIVLTRFQVGLEGRKWTAEVDYEANLIKDGRIIARERVSGSAERTKIMGTAGADKVISDIFTEIINRLNIERLFQQAML